MKKYMPVLVMALSMAFFSCKQNLDVYDVAIQNNSTNPVSGKISAADEEDTPFAVPIGGSTTIEVPAPYTVSYKNLYGRITGTIDYSSNRIVFADNPGMPLTLTNTTSATVYVFTGGYIQGENPTSGRYLVDGTEGFSVPASGTTATIYTPVPSFIARTATSGLPAKVTWIINSAGSPSMTGIIHY